MKGIRGLVLVIAILAVLFPAVACGGDDITTPPPATSVVLSAGSWETAGNGTVTGLPSGVKYIVTYGEGGNSRRQGRWDAGCDE